MALARETYACDRCGYAAVVSGKACPECGASVHEARGMRAGAALLGPGRYHRVTPALAIGVAAGLGAAWYAGDRLVYGGMIYLEDMATAEMLGWLAVLSILAYVVAETVITIVGGVYRPWNMRRPAGLGDTPSLQTDRTTTAFSVDLSESDAAAQATVSAAMERMRRGEQLSAADLKAIGAIPGATVTTPPHGARPS